MSEHIGYVFSGFDHDQVQTDHEQISNWLTNDMFNSTFIKENLSLSLLWIFSKYRIYKDNDRVQKIALFCYHTLNNLNKDNFESIQSVITFCEHQLSKLLKELPSIAGCLTEDEREIVNEKVSNLKLTDKAFRFRDSDQYFNLKKLSALPSVSSFLENYDELLDAATKQESKLSNKVGSIIEYILTEDDAIRDGIGLLGIVDDVFALQQLKHPELISEIESLKWEFELSYPNFRYPLLVSTNGKNLFRKVDNLIKSGTLNSSNPDRNLRYIKTSIPKPMSLIIAILSTITKIKLKKSVIEGADPYELQQDQTYKLSKRGAELYAQFKYISKIEGKDYFFFEFKNKKKTKYSNPTVKINIPQDMIRSTNIELSNSKTLSLSKELDKFYDSDVDVSGLYPFQAIENIEYDLNKSALICPKNIFSELTSIKFEGKTIKEWFGYISIKTNGDLESQQGLLSSAPLLIHASKDINLFNYLDDNKNELNEIHTINYVDKADFDDSLLMELKNMSSDVGVNLFLEKRLRSTEKKIKDFGFIEIEQLFESENPDIPYFKDIISSRLSLLGSVSKIKHLDNENKIIETYLKKINDINTQGSHNIELSLRALKSFVNKQNFPLSGHEIDIRTQKIDGHLRVLEKLKHISSKLPELLAFIQNNKNEIIHFNKLKNILQWLNRQDENENNKVLISSNSFSKILKSEKYAIDKFITLKELETNTEYINKLFVPSILESKVSDILATSNYANEIEILGFEDENIWLKKRISYLRANDDKKEISEVPVSDLNNDFLINDYRISEFTKSKSLQTEYENFQDARLIEFTNYQILPLPKGGKVISSTSIDDLGKNLKERNVMDLEFGDFVMVPDTRGGSLQDFILDEIDPEINAIRDAANLWKVSLEEYMQENDLDFNKLAQVLESNGLKREHQSIKNWLNNEHLIAPQRMDESIKKIFEITDNNQADAEKCIQSCHALYAKRDKVLHNLLEFLEDPIYTNDELSLKYKDKIFKFKFLEISDLAEEEVASKALYHIIE